jgi:hypothetical protein
MYYYARVFGNGIMMVLPSIVVLWSFLPFAFVARLQEVFPLPQHACDRILIVFKYTHSITLVSSKPVAMQGCILSISRYGDPIVGSQWNQIGQPDKLLSKLIVLVWDLLAVWGGSTPDFSQTMGHFTFIFSLRKSLSKLRHEIWKSDSI